MVSEIERLSSIVTVGIFLLTGIITGLMIGVASGLFFDPG
jgi:hypothetical protein